MHTYMYSSLYTCNCTVLYSSFFSENKNVNVSNFVRATSSSDFSFHGIANLYNIPRILKESIYLKCQYSSFSRSL